ncbi:uncharacterized [Tachysurus ichikawai]
MILPKVTSLKEPSTWHNPSGMKTQSRCSQHAWCVNDSDSSPPFSDSTLPQLSLTRLALSHARKSVEGGMAHMAVEKGGAAMTHLPAL